MPVSAADASASLVRRLLHYARPRQLQLVVCMAELGSIQQAAAALGMSQPSATQALHRVEQWLGLVLFDRHARGVRLTREGTLLVPGIRRALQAMEMLARDAAQVGQGAHGLVRIAGIAAASASIAASALPALCASLPDLWIDYREIDAAEIAALCQEDGADLILCRASTEIPRGHVFMPLRPDALAVYCASGHPLARRRSLDLDACADATWLLPPAGSPPHQAFLALCAQMQQPPKLARVGTRSLQVSVALVRQRQWLYVGLESHLGHLVDMGQLRRLPLAVPGMPDAIGLLHRTRLASPAAEAVARHLQQAAMPGSDSGRP